MHIAIGFGFASTGCKSLRKILWVFSGPVVHVQTLCWKGFTVGNLKWNLIFPLANYRIRFSQPITDNCTGSIDWLSISSHDH